MASKPKQAKPQVYHPPVAPPAPVAPPPKEIEIEQAASKGRVGRTVLSGAKPRVKTTKSEEDKDKKKSILGG